jgi:hypothetical protein
MIRHILGAVMSYLRWQRRRATRKLRTLAPAMRAASADYRYRLHRAPADGIHDRLAQALIRFFG